MKMNSRILCLVLTMFVALGMFTGAPALAEDQIIEVVEEIEEGIEEEKSVCRICSRLPLSKR